MQDNEKKGKLSFSFGSSWRIDKLTSLKSVMKVAQMARANLVGSVLIK